MTRVAGMAEAAAIENVEGGIVRRDGEADAVCSIDVARVDPDDLGFDGEDHVSTSLPHHVCTSICRIHSVRVCVCCLGLRRVTLGYTFLPSNLDPFVPILVFHEADQLDFACRQRGTRHASFCSEMTVGLKTLQTALANGFL